MKLKAFKFNLRNTVHLIVPTIKHYYMYARTRVYEFEAARVVAAHYLYILSACICLSFLTTFDTHFIQFNYLCLSNSTTLTSRPLIELLKKISFFFFNSVA